MTLEDLGWVGMWVGVSVLFYAWIGYPLLVRSISIMCRGSSSGGVPSAMITVVIAACNEEKNIAERIKDLEKCRWPSEDVEFLVVSDGSTDRTEEIVREMAADDPRVTLVGIHPQRGRANAHNESAKVARGEILVFTDAETTFEPNFLMEIARPFSDPRVGFASGALFYTNDDKGVARSSGLYWRMEQMLRRDESRSGLFVFGSGACCAVKRELFRDVPPTGDIDFTTPLDVALQGHLCIHCPDAKAYDVLPESSSREFRARVRMTSKNLHGTISRWGIGGILRHPIYTLTILSHKICKWITPFLMILVFACTLALASESAVAQVILLTQFAFILAAMLGALFPRLPLVPHAWSFMVANIAFGMGVCKAMLGRVPAAYRPLSQAAPEVNH